MSLCHGIHVSCGCFVNPILMVLFGISLYADVCNFRYI